mmetsp:Transcript_27760/g.55571  ORF Transcript_27760/g.55571 Transcript_27760/m.55571 type:complete len:147 (-) Transcript_27760:194-634(-)
MTFDIPSKENRRTFSTYKKVTNTPSSYKSVNDNALSLASRSRSTRSLSPRFVAPILHERATFERRDVASSPRLVYRASQRSNSFETYEKKGRDLSKIRSSFAQSFARLRTSCTDFLEGLSVGLRLGASNLDTDYDAAVRRDTYLEP